MMQFLGEGNDNYVKQSIMSGKEGNNNVMRRSVVSGKKVFNSASCK